MTLKYITVDPVVFEHNSADEAEMLDRYYKMLEHIIEIDQRFLKKYSKMPALENSGVKKSTLLESVMTPSVVDIRVMIARGSADVDSLAAWRIAELRLQDVHAEPVLIQTPRGEGAGVTFSLRVKLSDGTFDKVFDDLVGR